jgi:hypothetical protein
VAEKRFEREEWDRVWNFVRGLEAKIKGLDNNAQPTVPVYDPTHFPLNAIEGQIALGTDGSAYKYQDGAWSSFGGAGGGGAIYWEDVA